MMKNHTKNNRINSPSGNSGFKPIRHAPNAWSVSAPISQAPRRMMIREFVQNGLEAASMAAGSRTPGQVVISVLKVPSSGGPVRKLRIWNTGPGMDATELVRVMDLHATGGGKKNGVDANFGLGAKTAGLANNPAGLRYRSCRNGVVSELLLCKSGDDYGIQGQKDASNSFVLVVDRTQAAKSEGRCLKSDWTEVVLLGEDAEHDTTVEPFGKGKKEPSSWLADCINNRFDTLPKYVTVEIDASLDRNKRPQKRSLLGARESVRKSAGRKQMAEVSMPSGHRVRFALLAKKGQNRYALEGQVALVHKEELYDVRKAADWSRCCSRFGITYGQKQVVIQILLPNNEALPDQHRQRLERDEPDRPEVLVDEWAQEIAENLPDFIQKHVDAARPKDSSASNNLKSRLQNLVTQYGWHRNAMKLDPNGNARAGDPNSRGDGKGGRRGRGGSPTRSVNPGSKPASRTTVSRRGALPSIRWVDGGKASSTGHLARFAARYDHKIHEIALNNQYEGLEEAVKRVVTGWPNAHDQVALRAEALNLCKEEFVFRASKAVMSAFMHEGAVGWKPIDIETALHEQALTLHLDDVIEVSTAVRTRLACGKWGKPAG
ncbi:hypothetical protein OAG01_00225 [bacterium]|nr:hypothetical protein [bacterium]